MISQTARKRGHRLAALALAGLIFSAPVKADTPVSRSDLTGIVEKALDDSAVAAPAPRLPLELLPMTADPVLPEAVEEKAEHLGDGEASYYGYELAGNRTASGERFNPKALTAAHRTLPLGSRLRVTNKANGKSVVVRINDRGPFVKRRILDVSLGAAQEIQMVRAGKAMVKLELLP